MASPDEHNHRTTRVSNIVQPKRKQGGKGLKRGNLKSVHRLPLSYPSVGKSNGHDCCSLHDPGEWIPHESQELEKFALLHATRGGKIPTCLSITYVKLTIRRNQQADGDGKG